MGAKKPAPSWAPKPSAEPAALTLPVTVPTSEDVYKDLENPKTTAFAEVMKKVDEGKIVIDDAVLFCGRFDQNGMLLREAKSKSKPYRLVRLRTSKEYSEAIRESARRWAALPQRIEESGRKRRAKEALRAKLRGRKVREDLFQSSSDLGSLFAPDPNQFTEFTPYFNGPFAKQQYFDYFKGHARAFQQWNHNPVARRIITLLVQYALGRGFKVIAKNDKISDKWDEFNTENRITYKMRKYWMTETLIYGEDFIDVLRWISVDPSTIYDIICEGYGEFIDKVLYYQQMFQTATQTYAGQDVKGVPGARDSKVGHFIIRQIPYDQIIHIKQNVTSGEKRGRSVLYSVLGWLKRLTDTLEARALGEQLRASFVWDDCIDGTVEDVAAHGAKYNYIPVAPSIFVHNKAVERKPLAPMAGITGNGTTDVVNEILCLIATGMGIPKDHFNVLVSSSSRATAIVGSEPFTKVIEDLQEDCNDLLHQIIQRFCDQNGFDYKEEDWKIIFPSVVKDSTQDRLENIGYCESIGWFSKKRAATMAAAEMEQDDYDYDDEMQEIQKEGDAAQVSGSVGWKPPPLPPPGRTSKQVPGGMGTPGDQGDNPLHGDGKKKIVAQHRNL